MKRRILRLRLILVSVALGSVLTGCEWLDQNLRRHADHDLEGMAELKAEEEAIGSGPESDKNFFKSSRLSGAVSSEGRDIERSLGIQ